MNDREKSSLVAAFTSPALQRGDGLTILEVGRSFGRAVPTFSPGPTPLSVGRDIKDKSILPVASPLPGVFHCTASTSLTPPHSAQ